MRINKYFTEHGYASRREADRYIREGRVRINGKPALLGAVVGDKDVVTFDGKVLRPKKKLPVILAYHKPVGVECTHDKAVSQNILAAVRFPERVFYVGRLDRMSEGLILLTNAGEVANRITRSDELIEKEYLVRFAQSVPDSALKKFASGVNIGGYRTKQAKVFRKGVNSARIILTEGKNRQIRRMAERLGLSVTHLKRIRVMDVRLEKLPPGGWRKLSAHECEKIINRFGKSDN